MRVQLLILISAHLLFNRAASAETRKAPDIGRDVLITYGSPSWNTDPTRIDSAFLLLRDRTTNKMIQIQLEETEPDSSQFNGHFSLTLGERDRIVPEIFVPPQNQRSASDYKKLFQAIQNDSLVRKPVIWKKNPRGQSMLDVYDSREQAEKALKAYQDEVRLAQELKNKALVKPLPTEQTLAAAAQAEKRVALEKLALESARREAERVRLEQIEKQKAEERERQARALSERERTERQARARELAEEASALYQKAEFVGAESRFKEATHLDPENRSYYFKYGVCLYRNQKFNEALVTLKLAKVAPEREAEKKFFLGLSYYRLNEFDAAVREFSSVAATKDPQMAPNAIFYSGVIHFTQEQFEAAKKSFETVIDISNDPALDQQSEEYLDRIANAQAFAQMRQNKWSVSGTVGLMYDSNVLLAPDNASDQGSATNISDARLLTAGELAYRPILSEHHEWSTNVSGSLTNSAKNTAAQADPYIFNLALPYTYKGVLGSKGYRLNLRPNYELLWMAVNQGTKRNILRSYYLTADNTFVMTRDWFSTYTLEYRADDALSADSVGDNDADASRISLRTQQALFLDKGRKEAVIGNLGFVLNAAKGKNRRYQRIEIGTTYVRPVGWNTSWMANLNAYQARYPNTDPNRQDMNVALTTGFTKPVREWVTLGLLGSFTRNNSTVDTFAYSKYMLMTTATFNTIF